MYANELRSRGLIIEKAYISGKWQDFDDKIEVLNPATEEVIGTIPNTPIDSVLMAIKDSSLAQEKFKHSTGQNRHDLLVSWYDNMMKHADDFAKIITLENGKSLRESRAEIDYAAGYLTHFAKEALKDRSYEVEANQIFSKRKVDYVPIGVTAAITPWNFPLAMITRKAGAAIAAGCSMIIKPSELTPYTATLMCKLLIDSGMPENLIQIVTGYPKEIGEVFQNSFTIRKLSFTGSTAVGKILMRNSAETLKKLSMELGGNAPLIINESSNMDTIIKMVLNGKFRNNGQSCTAVNRVLIHENIYDKALENIIKTVSKLVVGDGFNDDTYLGTVITETALNRLERLMQIAVKQGAKLELGGKRLGNKGYFFEPTVLTGITNNMEIARQEIFGPVIAIQKFKTDNDAITIANDTDYGLAAYICGENQQQNIHMANSLNFGMIGINDTRLSDAKIPFGGIKNSGFGREGGEEGIFEYIETKYVALN